MKKHSTAKPIPCFKRWSRTNYAVFASLHRQVTIGVLAVGMSILLLTTETAAAQQADTSGVSRVMRIEPVGVTGTRLSPSRSIQSQTPVFDRGTEAAAPFQTLEDALRLSPSIDIRERSGKGVQADISIRGGSPDQTMMLLNGINFTDARTGHQTHSLPIDMDCVSGIELIEGIPGVGAYAGAVNVRTVPLYRNYLRLKAEGGQHGYGYTNLSGALTRDRLVLFAAGSLRRSDGYIHNTDFRNVNGYLRMTYDSPKAGFFDFQTGGQGRRFGSNGFYAAYNPDQFEQTATALGSLRWIKEWGLFRICADASYRKNFDRYEWTRGTPTNYHNTDNVGAELWGDLQWRGGSTSLGGDYIYHHIFSSNLGEPMAAPRRPLQVRSRTPRGQSVAAPFHEMAPFRYRRFGRCELYALRNVGLLGRIGTLRQRRLASGSRSRTVDAVTDVHRPLLYVGSAGQQSESQTRTSCHLPYRRRLRHRKMACLRTVLLPRRSQCNRLGVARRTDDRRPDPI